MLLWSSKNQKKLKQNLLTTISPEKAALLLNTPFQGGEVLLGPLQILEQVTEMYRVGEKVSLQRTSTSVVPLVITLIIRLVQKDA